MFLGCPDFVKFNNPKKSKKVYFICRVSEGGAQKVCKLEKLTKSSGTAIGGATKFVKSTKIDF